MNESLLFLVACLHSECNPSLLRTVVAFAAVNMHAVVVVVVAVFNVHTSVAVCFCC